MDQEFINELAEKLSKLGTKRPLGFHYAHPFGTVPSDSIQCNGAEYNRALYADFFAYANEQGWVKTETEWQEIASQNNGYCPYYSDGDGSTTFRTPKFAPFIQIAIASGNVGEYHEEGLPDIQGSLTFGLVRSSSVSASGCFTKKNGSRDNCVGTSKYTDYESIVTLKASTYNDVYGASSTVQPESHGWMICVVVFGVATNVGSADVGNVMSVVAQVQAELPNKLNNTTPHIVNTWKDNQGNWYRVWSDGFIEQGYTYAGNPKTNVEIPVTFPTQFSTTNYKVLCETSVTGWSHALNAEVKSGTKSTTGCTLRMSIYENQDVVDGLSFVAFGY